MKSAFPLLESSHILICRTDNIGDVVLTLPMVQRLRELVPGARITLLCRAYAMDIARLSCAVDDVVALEEIGDDPVAHLRRLAVDTIIFAQPDKKLALAAFRAGIPNRVGNARQKLYLMLFCNRRVRFSKRTSQDHEAQINFEFLRPFGCNTIPTREEISGYQHFLLPAPSADMMQLLDADHFHVIFHPCSNGHGREWPIGHFTELARRLGDHGGIKIWLTGSPGEGEWLRANAPELLAQAHVNDVCGRFSLAELAIFIDAADALIASGTGPLHLSGALDQRTIGLFPPTRPMHPGRWAALGRRSINLTSPEENCAHCDSNAGRTCACMAAITPERVGAIVEQWHKEDAARPMHQAALSAVR
ncbi:glycosyltransferase family 9 protein [Herbaspirillum sp. WKF16]|uniref:glycosyltransferase family 9 protein n=1 Tax=Herbaspirillum sp. WKF16 TaxID=3028312 RepID=UPI0023A997FF|nr:glycosyltransferase family 9 protein [Herbaspirillum sp. WKF16]WDZ95091.1 glycosyltransferase family 9 protein [Herbaspirillum sp. WKF16]